MTKENERQVVRHERRVDLTPPVDIYDEGDKVILIADMPGVNPEALEVRYERMESSAQTGPARAR